MFTILRIYSLSLLYRYDVLPPSSSFVSLSRPTCDSKSAGVCNKSTACAASPPLPFHSYCTSIPNDKSNSSTAVFFPSISPPHSFSFRGPAQSLSPAFHLMPIPIPRSVRNPVPTVLPMLIGQTGQKTLPKKKLSPIHKHLLLFICVILYS